ncbi:MAG TPA: CDP-glucose 4,6-dehydratase [Desulfobacterales bacterium]|nr:CDP-glucose 4,6-dehydratase [Desulfobacterales bacterium]HIP38875.1 CDP-glucose 4,6-dehydratase [Desulfocapsa sulfexigens]
MKPNRSFWKDKRVLLTGHSGFKGSWLAFWLSALGARVTGVSLPPLAEPNLFSLIKIDELIDSRYIDIRNAEQLSKLTREISPHVVFHLAAQPLVRAGYRDPLETFSSNIMGTANILESLRGVDSVQAAVIITTDKVYQNQEWPYPYRENDTLGGHDPYSSSKAAAEIVTSCYRDSFLADQGIAVATARAGNVIGGGDWSEDRLIPDAVRAWEDDTPLTIRSPMAIRPWQHVLEPLAGYLTLSEKISGRMELAGAYNFGPETNTAATVREVIEQANKSYGRGKIIWGDSSDGPHEAGFLTLDIAKAKTILGVKPRWSLKDAIEHTMTWYLQFSQGVDPCELCSAEITEYESLL